MPSAPSAPCCHVVRARCGHVWGNLCEVRLFMGAWPVSGGWCSVPPLTMRSQDEGDRPLAQGVYAHIVALISTQIQVARRHALTCSRFETLGVEGTRQPEVGAWATTDYMAGPSSGVGV